MNLLKKLAIGAGVVLSLYSSPSLAQENEKPSKLEQIIQKAKKLKTEATIAVAKNIRVYDIETKKFIRLDNFLQQQMQKNPEMFRGTDLEKDPVRTAVNLINNPQNIGKYKIVNLDSITQDTQTPTPTSVSPKPVITSSLETVIDKEITFRGGNWDLNKNITFGKFTYFINIIDSGRANINGLPTEISIKCGGYETQSFMFTPEILENLKRGKEYIINTPENEEELKLIFQNCEIVDFSEPNDLIQIDDRAIKQLTFRLKGTRKTQIITPEKNTTQEITPPTNLEYTVLKYLKENPNRRLFDIVNITGSSDKTKEILSDLLDKDKIKIENKRYSLTSKVTEYQTPEEKPEKILKPTGKIIFSSVGSTNSNTAEGIYIINSDGSNVRKLIKYYTREFGVSPEGRELIFEFKNNFYTLNLETSDVKDLIVNNRYWDMEALWSPDGENVSFVRSIKGKKGCSIYIKNVENSRFRRLSKNRNYNRDVSWSPDGENIVFSSTTLNSDKHFIYSINKNGSNLKKLIECKDYVENPVWSPDGKSISFIKNENNITNLYLMNNDSSNLKKITNNTLKGGTYYCWSPDGKSIVFDTGNGKVKELYKVDIDNLNISRLTNNDYAEYGPSWSPDGKNIAFISQKDEGSNIYLITPDGSNYRRVTKNRNIDYPLLWVKP